MLRETNSNIFNDLATLCEAGISILDAARRVAGSHPNLQAWSGVIVLLERGNRLSLALGKNGLISRYEQEVISVAEYAGRVSEGLRSISNSYEKRLARISRLKSKLYYPFAILVVGIVISVLLQIFRNPEISKTTIIGSAVIWLVIAILFTRMILNLMQKDGCTWLSFAQQHSASEWYRLQFQSVVFGALSWHISSGIDFKTAFQRISKLIDSKVVRKQLLLTSSLCGQGLSVTNAIQQGQLPITSDFSQVLKVAEQSGRWEYSVKKYLEQNEMLLDLRIDNAFEWVPRFYYGLVVLVVIGVIL